MNIFRDVFSLFLSESPPKEVLQKHQNAAQRTNGKKKRNPCTLEVMERPLKLIVVHPGIVDEINPY